MTAQETARKIGAKQGYTIEGFTTAVDRDRLALTERSVLIVDEYVMLDTFRAADLLRVAGGAQIICVGDHPRQLQGIGASGWQADVEEALPRRGQAPVELTNVHRQREAADREMLAAQRSGDAADALANLAARGRFRVAATPEQADGEVIAAYKRFRDQGRSVNDRFVNTDNLQRPGRHLQPPDPGRPAGSRRDRRAPSTSAPGHDRAHQRGAARAVVRLDDGRRSGSTLPCRTPWCLCASPMPDTPRGPRARRRRWSWSCPEARTRRWKRIGAVGGGVGEDVDFFLAP